MAHGRMVAVVRRDIAGKAIACRGGGPAGPGGLSRSWSGPLKIKTPCKELSLQGLLQVFANQQFEQLLLFGKLSKYCRKLIWGKFT